MDESFIDTRNSKHWYELALSRFLQDPNISDRNKQIISSFLRDAALGKTVFGRSKKAIGHSRLSGHLSHLAIPIRFLQLDLDKLTQADMERFIEALENDSIRSRGTRLIGRANLVVTGAPLSTSYKRDIKVTLKIFYRWLLGDSKTIPDIVAWIDTFDRPNEVPSLTPAEVERMVDRAKTSLNRALIQVLFDGGFRLGELLNIRLQHVRLQSAEPKDPRAYFLLRAPFSKTLRRTVALPMPETTKWLTMWIEDHPARPMILPDGSLEGSDLMFPLFPMSGSAVRSMVRRIGKITLGKRVYPHLLRHTSATFWSNKLSHFKLCKRFGWVMTSSMAQRYIDREGVDDLDVVEIFHQKELSQQDKEKQGLLDEIARLKAQLLENTPPRWRELEPSAFIDEPQHVQPSQGMRGRTRRLSIDKL